MRSEFMPDIHRVPDSESGVLAHLRRPGSITAEVAVPFDMPRQPSLRAEAPFARLCGEISELLRRAMA